MTDLLERFQALHIQTEEIQHPDVSLPLIKISLEGKQPVTVLMTNGLSRKEMPVPSSSVEPKRVELYWCLPDYWDLTNPNLNWMFSWTDKLIHHLLDKEQVWYGDGHTFHSGKLSTSMKQEYLMLMKPFLLDELFSQENKLSDLGFLAIVPLFKAEFEFKQRKGTFSLINKMVDQGVSEVLDDYRESLLKRKFGLF